MSEDLCLICKMAPQLVKGIESPDASSCVKHYALNNQELNRFYVNVKVGRCALHEIYLKGFYSAIIEGEASSVMGAFNKYEDQHCCHNDYLVNKVLKDKWGFKGVYLSDWSGAHDTDECIYNGLDIEMGGEKPFTLSKSYEDTSVYRYGEYKPDDCHYNDDIFVGYRAFDNDNIEPLFPFGHGISYTEF